MMNHHRIKIDSVVKCIKCGHKELHHMPIYAAKTYYECPNCQTVHRPLEDKCCIYCSYGSTLCPPTQRRLNAVNINGIAELKAGSPVHVKP